MDSNYCIDSSRIFATGKSNGGGMVDLLACSRNHGGAFAAFAPVIGAYYRDLNTSKCQPPNSPTPILEFHGLSDERIPYAGGHGEEGAPLPPVLDWLHRWAQRDGSPDDTIPTVKNLSSYDIVSYTCNDVPNIVQHYAVHNWGHEWPKKNQTTGIGIDASRIILSFFRSHAKGQQTNQLESIQVPSNE